MASRAHRALSLSAAQQRVPAASVHATERGTALALPGSRDGMPIPAELQSLLSELNISPPTKEHAPVETVEALIAAVTDLDCSFSKNLLIKDKKAGSLVRACAFGAAAARLLRRPWARLVALCAACTPEGCSRATVRAARTASASTAAPKPPRAAAP